MKVHELIHELNSLDQDAEVHLATQPNYPLEHGVSVVVQTDPTEGLEITRGRPWQDNDAQADISGWWIYDPNDEDYEPRGPFVERDGAKIGLEQMAHDHTPIVYIAEGESHNYLSAEARRAVGW
jgi:hypothetical protein